MSQEKELSELKLKGGRYVTRYDEQEFSGVIVSRYPSGEVHVKTTVESGR